MKIAGHQINSIQEIPDTKSFRYNGCGNCSNGLGTETTTCKAWYDNHNYYFRIVLCDDCLNAYYNNDDLNELCFNRFLI